MLTFNFMFTIIKCAWQHVFDSVKFQMVGEKERERKKREMDGENDRD